MQLAKTQQGMTAIGWLISILIAAFFGLLLIRFIPLYFQDFSIVGVLNSVTSEPIVITSQNTNDLTTIVRDRLRKNLQINNLSEALTSENIELSASSEGVLIQVNYDAKTHIIFNIDAIVHFQHSALVPVK